LINSDKNQTDLHRFEPNSRAVLINEQFNFLFFLQNKATTSRHRGDKQKCRYDRLIFIILLSLWYFLAVEQRACHSNSLDQ